MRQTFITAALELPRQLAVGPAAPGAGLYMQTCQLLPTLCHLMDQKAPLVPRLEHEFASNCSRSFLPSSVSSLISTWERHLYPLTCSEDTPTTSSQQTCWLLMVSAHPCCAESPHQPDRLLQPSHRSSLSRGWGTRAPKAASLWQSRAPCRYQQCWDHRSTFPEWSKCPWRLQSCSGEETFSLLLLLP